MLILRDIFATLKIVQFAQHFFKIWVIFLSLFDVLFGHGEKKQNWQQIFRMETF